MRTFNIREAKTQFSRLIAAASRGEHILIARADKPVAMLVPIRVEKQVRNPGAMKGKIHIAADFDSALPADVQGAFEGR